MDKDDRKYIKMEMEQWIGKNIGPFLKEVVFSKIMDTKRMFRADYLVNHVIIEINGGQWGIPVTCDKCGKPVERKGVNGKKWRVMSQGGRHTRAGSYEEDLRKLNLAASNGFLYMQFTYEMLRDGDYKQVLLNLVDNRINPQEELF